MGIFRICLEEQRLIKSYVIKQLMLLKIQNMLASIVDKFFDKKSSGGGVKSDIMSNQRHLDLATRE